MFDFFRFHIWVMSYSACLSLVYIILLNIVCSRFIHVVTNGRIYSFLMDEEYYLLCVSLFYPFIVDGLFGCFHILAIVNSATLNTGVHISHWVTVFISLGIFWEAEFLDSRSSFNFLRYLHIVFRSGWTNLHSFRQCLRVSFSPRPHCHLLSLDSHINRYEVIFCCGFYLYFPDD